MFGSFRLRRLLPLGTLVLATLLGGCVYPVYPGYGYYSGGYYGNHYYGGRYYGGYGRWGGYPYYYGGW